MFDKIGDLSGLISEAKRIQDEMKRIQTDLAAKIVEATVGGGMVTARVNGQQELVAIKIDPQALQGGDVEMLEDLVVAAVSQAMKRSQEMAKEAFGRLTGGLQIPGLT